MRRVQSTLQLATKQSVRLASPLQSLPLLGLSSRISGPTVNLTTRSLLLSTKPSFTISQPTRNTKVSSFASPSPPTIRFFTSFAQLNQFLFSKAPPGFKKFWPNSSEPSEEDSEDKKKNGKEEKDDDDGMPYVLFLSACRAIVLSVVVDPPRRLALYYCVICRLFLSVCGHCLCPPPCLLTSSYLLLRWWEEVAR